MRTNLNAPLPAALVALALAAWAAHPARADVERFAYTYGWSTSSKGEAELEVRHTQPATGHRWQDAYALEYGVTDRYMIEPYIIVNHSGGFRDVPTSGGVDADGDAVGGGGDGSEVWDPIHNGSAYRYGGFQLEQRYRFGDYGYNKLLASAYVEYENLRDANQQIESKAILQFDPKPEITTALNIIGSTPISPGGGTSWGYSFGAAYLPDFKHNRYWVGGEAFGNFTTKVHYAGPTLGFSIDQKTRLVGTYGKQIKGSGGDQFRIQINHEFN